MTPMARVAGALRITEGQVYTVATGLVVAVLLLGLGLPQVDDVAAQLPGAVAPRTRPLALPGSPAVAAVIAAPPAPAAPLGTGLAPEPTLGELTGPTFDSPGGSGPGDTPTFGGGRSAGDARPTPSASTVPERPSDIAAPPPAPLHVAEGRYATASGPLVPAGGPGAFLPVTLRVGAPDKQSYLRLAGTGTTLRLPLSSQPGHQFGEVTAVRACRIIPPDWRIEDGSSLAAAPAVDPIDCTLGRPSSAEWTFELAGIDTSNGVALVPSGPSTGTFQVTFTAGTKP